MSEVPLYDLFMKVNLLHAINFRAKYGENLVTYMYSKLRSHNTRSHTGHSDVDVNYLTSAH